MKEETYRRATAGDHPANLSPDYKSTVGRSPRKSAVVLPHSLSEITGPSLATERLDASENDLTKQRMAEPLGERIIVQGRVLDQDGKPVPGPMPTAITSSSPSSPAPIPGRTITTPGGRRTSTSRCSGRLSPRA